MWEKVKQYSSAVWAVITTVLVVAVAVLVELFKRKQDENAALKAKDVLNETDKKSALLDKDIEQKQKENAVIETKIVSDDKVISDLEQQHNQAIQKEKDRPSDQVEDYWKNN